MVSEPYISSEDSSLLREALRRYSGEACLEIGAGSGGNLIELAKKFTLVVGTDLVRPAMEDWRVSADFLVTDGARCVRDHQFDLVAFNPPYLLERQDVDRAVEGGEALEVPLMFLREGLRAVKRDGKVVMLLNDQADLKVFEQVCSAEGFGVRRVASRRVFFEELAVYEASRLEGG